MPEITAAAGSAVVLPADPTSSGLIVLDPADGVNSLAGVDVVFPALHGAYGEDGTIQGMLEMAGIPYVGGERLRLRGGHGQGVHQEARRRRGHPGRAVRGAAGRLSLAEADKERLGLPVFVKPSRAGSSYGITKVTDWADLDAAVATARQIDPKVLVEAAIVGREIECGVLEGEAGGAPEASLLAEIHVVAHDFYDFEAKYLERQRLRHPGRRCRTTSPGRSRSTPGGPSPRSTAPGWPASTSS